MHVNSLSIVAGSIVLGLEPVQASPTAFSEIVAIFSLNSSSLIPKSFNVAGIFKITLNSLIFSQRLLMSAFSDAPPSPTNLAISAYLLAATGSFALYLITYGRYIAFASPCVICPVENAAPVL